MQTSKGGLALGILAPPTMSHFAIYENDRNALEQFAGVRSTTAKTAAVGGVAATGAKIVALEGPATAAAAALAVAYNSPTLICKR